MIKLTIEHLPPSLSPSSLTAFENMPNTAYMQRLCNEEWRLPREPQGKAAAAGTAFDILVKKFLMSQGVQRLSRGPLEDSLERHVLWAMEQGKEMLDVYIDSGATTGLVFDHVDSAYYIESEQVGGRLVGKPDAAIHLGGLERPIALDWKVVGANAKEGMSPRGGYYTKYAKGSWGGKHSLCSGTSNFTLAELVDEKWASQLAVYNWMLGWPIGETSYGAIHSIIYNGKDRNIIVCKYLLLISSEFQMRLAQRFKNVWTSLKDGSYLNRLASEHDLDAVAMASVSEKWF